MHKLIFVICTLLLFTSCGEENLTLTINSPKNGTVYAQGETIVISFTVTDDIDITTIAYYNRDLGTGHIDDLLGDQTEYSGQFSFPAIADPGNYDISVSATDENMNNVVEEIVSIVIQ